MLVMFCFNVTYRQDHAQENLVKKIDRVGRRQRSGVIALQQTTINLTNHIY